MFDDIVIGVDGREGGRRAAALARQLAADGAEITLANVYGARTFVGGRTAGFSSILESEAAEDSEVLLERERQAAGLNGAEILRSSERSVGKGVQVMSVVPVNVRSFWERLPQSSPEAAEKREQLSRWREAFGLLIVRARGQRALGRSVTGSVATHLAVHSACPLLIWPRIPVGHRRTSREAEATTVSGG